MAEQFLKPMEVAKRLKLKRTRFYAIRPKLVAMGLKRIKIAGTVRYLESSLDEAMLRLANQE
jgi:predicted DNA-binding transcriptional regulator AlpA